MYGTTLALKHGVRALHSPVSQCPPPVLQPVRAPTVPAQPLFTEMRLCSPGTST